MPVRVSPLTEADIPGAVSAIQQAFADDPYNNWVFDKSTFNPQRNAASLAIRCRWGIRNGIFHVAKEEGSDEVLGVACWLRPQKAGQPQSWHDWLEGWRLWLSQVGMNLYYGRGGLNVKCWFGNRNTQETLFWKGRPLAQPAEDHGSFQRPRQMSDQNQRSGYRHLSNLYTPYRGPKTANSMTNGQRYYIWKEAQAKAQFAVWTDPRGYYFLNIMVVAPQAQNKGIGRLMMKAVTDQADAEGMMCYLESSRDVPNMQIYGRFGFKFAKELECDDDGTAIKLYAMVREPNAGPQTN